MGSPPPPVALLADPDGASERVVLVDSVGVLAEIYRAGHLAYVGGSFTTGVHNTMEPAVAGMPVLFGPRIQNAEEAGVLVRQGRGWVCRRPPEALAARQCAAGRPRGWLPPAGEAARQVVLDQRGATARSIDVHPALARSGPGRPSSIGDGVGVAGPLEAP
jgi:3-deoxy-D-manno-octulosonic-acid transferase